MNVVHTCLEILMIPPKVHHFEPLVVDVLLVCLVVGRPDIPPCVIDLMPCSKLSQWPEYIIEVLRRLVTIILLLCHNPYL